MSEIPRVLDRWELLSFLGEGTLGSVYLVADHDHAGRHAALKLILPERLAVVDGADLDATFTRLRDLRHPHLVEVREFARIPDLDAIAVEMEYLQGETLFATAAGDRFDPLAAWGAQACEALAFLHASGFVHRNLKPENVRIAQPGESDPARTSGDPVAARAVLLDPVLADWMAPPRSGRRTGATFAYSAPELLLNHPPTVESDLYSIGVLLFEAATRRLPFVGDDALSLMRQHLAMQVPDPRQVNPRIPASLARVLLKLLAIEPMDRFEDAQEAAEALSKVTAPLRVETKRVQRVFVPWGRLMGRDTVLAGFRRLLDFHCGKSPTPVPPLLLTLGEPGLGKTRLQRECRSQAQVNGVPYIVVRCPETACAPMEPAADLVAQLAGVLEDLVEIPARHRLRADYADLFAHLAPEERRPAADPTAPDAPTEVVWPSRTAQFVLDVSRRVPLAVTFDDLHRADAGTLAMLEEIAAELAQPDDAAVAPARLAILCSAQPVTAAPFSDWLRRTRLRGWLSESRLEPLSPADIVALTRSMAGSGGEEVAQRIDLAGRSRGNPLLVEEILRETFEGAGEDAEPRSLDAIVALRWQRLSTDARGALEGLAVYGRPAGAERLARFLGLAIEEAQRALDEGERVHLLARERHTTHLSLYRFHHERAREAVLANMAAAARRELHRRIGVVLLEEVLPAGACRPAEAAFHLAEGGDGGRGAAARREADRDAERNGIPAASPADPEGSSVARTPDGPIAETGIPAGLRPAEALLARAPGAVQVARFRSACGDRRRAEQAWRRAVRETRGTGRNRVAGVALIELASLHAEQGRGDDALDRLCEADEQLRHAGLPGRSGVALLRGFLLLERGDAAEARRCAEVSGRRAERAGEQSHHVRALALAGEAAVHLGELDAAREALEEAWHRMHAGVDSRAVLETRAGWAHLRVAAGDRESARTDADELLDLATETGDRWAAWIAHGIRARAAFAAEGASTAAAHLERAVHEAAVLARPPLLARSLAALAYARESAGCADPVVCEPLGRAEELWVDVTPEPPDRVWADLAVARLHRRHGRREAEGEALDRAAERLRHRPLPEFRWRVHAERSRWAAASARPGECRSEARRAFETLRSVWSRVPDLWRETYLADPEKQRFREEISSLTRG